MSANCKMPVGTRRSTRSNPASSITEDDNRAEPKRKTRTKSSKRTGSGKGVEDESTNVPTTAETTVDCVVDDTECENKPKPVSPVKQGLGESEETELIKEKNAESCDVGQTSDNLKIEQIDGSASKKYKQEEKEIDLSSVIRSTMEAYRQESVGQSHIKGKPKSGRVWKTEQTARFSSMRKDKPLKSSWQLKMAQKAEKMSVRKFQQELHDAKRDAILMKKQRKAEQEKRREENQKKSEVVQVIRNTAKLKRMKKKQLRYLEKR